MIGEKHFTSTLGLMYFVGLRISESISGISSSRIGEEFRAIRLINSAFFKRLYLFSPSRLALAFNSGSFLSILIRKIKK